MPEINVGFKNQPILNLAIDNTDLGNRYVDLVKKNYKKQFPVFRDSAKYTVEYMHSLAEKAKQELNWNWNSNTYSVDITTQLHTNLVELLSVNGFDTVPEHLDSLIHELHYCLHTLEHGTKSRTSWLQIEWFNTDGFDLSYDFKFQTHIEFGALKLQNPYVGHPPQQVFAENDFSNIDSTCKFHDKVTPGVMIYIMEQPTIINQKRVLDAFEEHAPNFVKKHGVEKIKHYTGAPVIGHVTNLDALRQVVQSPLLELDFIEFV